MSSGKAEIAGDMVDRGGGGPTYLYLSLYLLYTLLLHIKMLTSPFTNRTQGSKPSAQILKAAKTAANSPHALINLTRLIKSLDSKIPVSDPDDSPLIEISGSVVQRRKDWEVSFISLRCGKLFGIEVKS